MIISEKYINITCKSISLTNFISILFQQAPLLLGIKVISWKFAQRKTSTSCTCGVLKHDGVGASVLCKTFRAHKHQTAFKDGEEGYDTKEQSQRCHAMWPTSKH